MTMCATEHVHDWADPFAEHVADVRCACGVAWLEWYREGVR